MTSARGRCVQCGQLVNYGCVVVQVKGTLRQVTMQRQFTVKGLRTCRMANFGLSYVGDFVGSFDVHTWVCLCDVCSVRACVCVCVRVCVSSPT